MKRASQVTVEKTFLVSRRMGWSFLICFVFAGLAGIFIESSNPSWLDILIPLVGTIALLLLAISWLMPGIFIVLGTPWLARAWLRGMNSTISDKPWEELSVIQIFFTYLWSITISGFTVLGIIALIRINFLK